MIDGTEPMRTFSDLLQFYQKKGDEPQPGKGKGQGKGGPEKAQDKGQDKGQGKQQGNDPKSAPASDHVDAPKPDNDVSQPTDSLPPTIAAPPSDATPPEAPGEGA